MFALFVATCARAETQPNIVVFIVDDLGWQDCSVPMHTERTPFNDRYRTPSLERLAERGVIFRNGYAAAPVCTPTRVALMTGQCPARTHVTYWTLNKDTDTSRPRDDIAAPAWNLNGLQPGAPTLPGLLRDAGYHTMHVGKAHFGARDTPGADPTNLGFDVTVAGHAAGAPGSYYGIHDFRAGKRSGNPDQASVWDVPGLEPYHGEEIYLTEALTIEATRLLREAAAMHKPFFLDFAPYAVHAPIMVNERYAEQYEGIDPREQAYATMIETVDTALGSILDTLDDLGLTDNTIIVFTSDNGGLSAHARGGEPHTHNAPLRSGKGSAYEGGTREPWVIAWPGVTDDAGARTEPIITQDLFPTLLAAAGVALPADHTIDGIDLGPLLRQEPWPHADRVLGWNQPHQWGASGPGIWPFTSIRVGDEKLIYFHAKRHFELYDLDQDIGETHDLAGEHPERVRELATIMQQWIDETGAQLSIDKATGEEIKGPSLAVRIRELEIEHSRGP